MAAVGDVWLRLDHGSEVRKGRRGRRRRAPGGRRRDPAGVTLTPMQIQRLDHLVLTVADLDRTIAFYRDVLGMEALTFGGGRRALAFGPHRINLHLAGHEFEPKAVHPVPGSGDICLICADPVEDVLLALARHGVEVVEGPVAREGAAGALESVYVRDPDGNLVEIAGVR